MEYSLPWLYKYPDAQGFSKLGYKQKAVLNIVKFVVVEIDVSQRLAVKTNHAFFLFSAC